MIPVGKASPPMQKLLVFQSLWAMERRRPDGLEWPLEEKIRMIAEAGFDTPSKDERLARSGPLRISSGRERLARLGGLMHSLSPLAVLDRGYALAWGPGGVILRDAAAVGRGDAVRVRLSRGGLECRVERTLPPEAGGANEDVRKSPE